MVKERFDDIVIVLNIGGIMDLSWVKNDDQISSALLGWQGGMEGGLAMAELLTGKGNPSGKLADTFAADVNDYPSTANFHESFDYVNYTEDIYVGYRFFETLPGAQEKVIYPFGYGLSYTTFEYSNLSFSADEIGENDELIVRVNVKNTGNFDGKEIVQLYVRECSPKIARPVKELKGFKKIFLKKGEEKSVEFTLDRRAFAYWDEKNGDWRVEGGKYEILVGAASSDIRASKEIAIHAQHSPEKLTIYSYLRDLRLHPNGKEAMAHILKLMGKDEKDVFSDNEKDSLTSLDWCILRNIVTMFGLKMTISDLEKLIEEVNG